MILKKVPLMMILKPLKRFFNDVIKKVSWTEGLQLY